MAKYKEIKYDSVFPASNLSGFDFRVDFVADADFIAELSMGGGIEVYGPDGTTPIDFGIIDELSDLASGNLAILFSVDPLTAASTGDVIARVRYGAGLSTVNEVKADVAVAAGYIFFSPCAQTTGDLASNGIHNWVTNTKIGSQSGGVTGLGADGFQFDGVNDFISLPLISALEGASEFTFLSLVNFVPNGDDLGAIFSYGVNADSANDILFATASGSTFYQVGNGGDGSATIPTGDYVSGTLAQIGIVFNSGSLEVAINGAFVSTALNYTVPGTTATNGSNTARIGSYVSFPNSWYLQGLIQEISISNVAKTEDWAGFHYANRLGGGTYTIGAEVDEGGGVDDIEGACDLVFDDGSSTLTGVGSLAGVAAMTFGAGSSTVRGSGALAGTAAGSFAAGSSTLTGSGALAGNSTATFGAGSSTLTGTIAAAGSAAIVFAGSLRVGGDVTGSTALSFSPSATLTAGGALAGSAAISISGAGAMAGAGALAGSSTITFSAQLESADPGTGPACILDVDHTTELILEIDHTTEILFAVDHNGCLCQR